MTRAKYPPLPASSRPMFRRARSFGIATAVLSVFVAGLAIRANRWDLAASVVALGLVFSALTWIHPLSGWFAPIATALGFGMGLVAFQATGRLWLTLVFTPVVLIAVFRRPLAGSRILVDLDPDKVQIAAPALVMKNAEIFQEEFLANRFRSVGAKTFVVGRTTVISSLLVSPTSDAYASVTDAILHVTSVFPGGRVLVTRNNDVSPLPAYVLTNGLSGAAPRELIDSHAEALTLLAAHDHRPMLLVADEIPQRAVDSDRDGIIWMKRQRDLKLKAGERGPLVGRTNLPALIHVWAAASSDANGTGTA